MRITVNWAENLTKRAGGGWYTARHAVILGVSLAGVFSPVTNPAWAASDVVISQVYGGGGGLQAPFKHDFVELFNRGSTAASLADWTVQYASATGNTWNATPLAGTLQPGQHFLIDLARGNRGGPDLPTPDVTGHLSLASKSGKVALVNSATALTCGTPCLPDPRIQDLVGYGSANSFEGTAAATPLSSTTAALRKDNGCVDTDSNTADFTVGTPAPRNSASPLHPCTPDSATRIHDIKAQDTSHPVKIRL